MVTPILKTAVRTTAKRKGKVKTVRSTDISRRSASLARQAMRNENRAGRRRYKQEVSAQRGKTQRSAVRSTSGASVATSGINEAGDITQADYSGSYNNKSPNENANKMANQVNGGVGYDGKSIIDYRDADFA